MPPLLQLRFRSLPTADLWEENTSVWKANFEIRGCGRGITCRYITIVRTQPTEPFGQKVKRLLRSQTKYSEPWLVLTDMEIY